jgi:hypothetical protein
MLYNVMPALVVTAGLLQGLPAPVYELPRVLPPRMLPPRVLPLPLPGPNAVPRPAAPGCLSPGEARAMAQSGQVVPLGSVLGQIRQTGGGQIVSPPALCNMGGRMIHFLDVLVGGRVIRMQVDGQTGRVGQ